MKTYLAIYFAAMTAFYSSFAAAHFPLMQCWFSGNSIICEAGFSDASKAVDYSVELYDYEDNLLAKKTTDKRSKVEFANPNVEFYLVFDAGHEAPVEVDHVEMKTR